MPRGEPNITAFGAPEAAVLQNFPQNPLLGGTTGRAECHSGHCASQNSFSLIEIQIQVGLAKTPAIGLVNNEFVAHPDSGWVSS